MTFDDLGLEPTLLSAIKDAGYTTPTPIQAAAIPEALKGRDVLGIAQTGTGKTASFVLPIIHRLAKGRARARMPRSLILAPTRELAAQVSENFEKYGKNHKLSMALLIGGVSFGDQDAKLMRGVDVLIATPGRLIDQHERGKLLLTGLEVMVVDEADRMLDMGFIPDIEKIFKLTPFTRQTLFFSATMPPEIQRITDQFLSAPVRVETERQSTTAKTITQQIVRLPKSDDKLKRAVLRKLIDEAEELNNGIIFCNRKKNVDVLATSLQKHGHGARPIHGDLPQAFRTETLQSFRDGDLKLLVASDVAARGLDIPEVSHVFNYSVPVNAEDYVHRIGRTGRAGRKGRTIMLVTPDDAKQFDAVLKLTGLESIEEIDMGDFFDNVDLTDSKPARGRKSAGSNRRSKVASSSDDGEVQAPKTSSASKSSPSRRDDDDDNTGSADRGRKGGREPVFGFGDHVPDFFAP
ncbi:DEAD/DEAH box helicase [Parvularcula sp. LCG005]|uniref:DEAD/DEAH box helicase n=1 Tax=Parvularcula sp. LCG005 TaxID=3078805 RepID=UPI002941D3CA|nr:DEAD/DEAH box helicase [Parvularcula sp. LCG005]WOI52237.1 DEAD/DEAH box helicase [Parvularcula sp. LCG005]